MHKTMDKEPFFEFDFENISKEDIETLSLFCKNGFNLSKLLKKGEELNTVVVDTTYSVQVHIIS